MRDKLRAREIVAQNIDKIKTSAVNKKIVRYRFGLLTKEAHTLEETAFKYGLSRQRIHQIEQAVLEKIKSLPR